MAPTTQPFRTRTLMHLLMLSLILAVPAQARDRYVPFIESLQAKQQRAYRLAAPSGVDEATIQSEAPVTVPVDVTVMPSEDASRIESLAQERSGPLSLAETQQDQVLDTELELFGYDVFQQAPGAVLPLDGIPVPSSYRIGPGDHLVVQLYGKQNVEYKLVVTRDGNILVPEYGPVPVAGLSFDEAEAVLVEGFERRVIGVRAVVTMGQLRTIQIRLAGDVLRPGIYTIGGLSTLVDALLTTGGVRTTGTLRDIQLIRDGQHVTTLDLYELLLSGRGGSDTFLQHNDTIFVPPIGDVVAVGGEVQRPAIYELRGGESVGRVIDMAGGLMATASLEDSHIERIQARGYRTLIDFMDAGDRASILGLPVANGDVLRVLPLEDELEGVVLLTGQVERPGGYQYRDGMRVSDLLGSAASLLSGVDIDVFLIRREDERTLRTSVLIGDLLQALEQPGGAQDLPLRPRDEILVFSLAGERARDLSLCEPWSWRRQRADRPRSCRSRAPWFTRVVFPWSEKPDCSRRCRSQVGCSRARTSTTAWSCGPGFRAARWRP